VNDPVSTTATGASRGHLFRNMVLFARLLRAVGLDVSPLQLRDWLGATELIDLRYRDDFRDTAEVVLISRHEELAIFREAFDLFWQARDPRELSELDLGLMIKKTKQRTKRRQEQALLGRQGADDGADDAPPEEQKIRTYSDSEVLRHKDFADLEASELEQVKSLMMGMKWQLDERRTRRRVASKHGRDIDPRRSLRRSLGKGGELIEWSRRKRKHKRRPLILLCDISGSMEPYSRILLQFLYVMTSGMQRVESFVFGTRLTRITQHLRERDVDSALRSVHRDVEDFGGGTRIGAALKTFNFEWGRRVLGQGAAVLIISDGWDRGDVDTLRREMERLQRSCHRLIWLNPLLGSPRYEPLTRGIQAALPLIDDFLPVHNLESLEQLATHLQRLPRGGSRTSVRGGPGTTLGGRSRLASI